MSVLYALSVKNGIPPQYFLDIMELYELKAIINQYENDYQENWGQIRIIAYSGYQPQELKFPWDEDEDKIVSTEEEKEATRKFALELQNKMNGVNN